MKTRPSASRVDSRPRPSRAPRALLAAALLFLASLSPALALGLRISRVDTAAFPRVEAAVSVADAAGRPVTGLALDDFRVSEPSGMVKPASLSTYSASGRGLDIVVLMDVSPSMKGAPFTESRNAALALSDDMSPRDRVSVGTFYDSCIFSAFSNDPGVVKGEIQKVELALRPGKTELFRAVFEALSRFPADDGKGLKALFVTSDGHDEGRAYTLDDCIAKARAENVLVFAVGLAKDADLSHLANLERLADLTGGLYVHANTAEDVMPAYQNAMALVRAQYLVTWESRAAADGRPQPFEILLVDSQKRAELGRAGGDVTALPRGGFKKSVPSEAAPATASGGAAKRGRGGAGIFDSGRLRLFLIPAAFLILLILLLAAIVARRRRRSAALEAGPHPGSPAVLEERADGDDAPSPGLPAHPGGGPETGSAREHLPPPVEAASPEPRVTRMMRGSERAFSEPAYAEAWLTVLEGPLAGRVFPIVEAELLLGRDPETGLDLSDAGVSLIHAKIVRDGGVFRIMDMGSRNGTFLGNVMVRSPHALHSGQKIRLGQTVLVFEGRTT